MTTREQGLYFDLPARATTESEGPNPEHTGTFGNAALHAAPPEP